MRNGDYVLNMVLAEAAAQGTAAEENRAAAAAACQYRFLPFVEHGFRHQSGIRAAAEAQKTGGPVHPALPGAEGAVCIIHGEASHNTALFPASYHFFRSLTSPRFTAGENCAILL